LIHSLPPVTHPFPSSLDIARRDGLAFVADAVHRNDPPMLHEEPQDAGVEKLGKACRLLKKFQMQGRREEETGAYWVVREDFRRPRTQQMDFFSSLLAFNSSWNSRTKHVPAAVS